MKRSASFEKKHQIKRRPNKHWPDGYVAYYDVDESATQNKIIKVCFEKVADGSMYVVWLDTDDEEEESFNAIKKRVKNDSDFRENLNAHVAGIQGRGSETDEEDVGAPSRKLLFIMKPNDMCSEEEFEEHFLEEVKQKSIE